MAQTSKFERKFQVCKFGTPTYKRLVKWIIRFSDKTREYLDPPTLETVRRGLKDSAEGRITQRSGFTKFI